MHELEWTQRARCQGAEATLFFARDLVTARPALALCDRCPVKDPCLDYALGHDIEHGIWGGLTERQRRALARRETFAGATP